MSFLNLNIKDLYVTDTSDIPEDFYGVVLPETILYKRAAGFFSSSALVTLGLGLKQFYYNGGKMQLLVSPNFCKEDYEAIELGYKAQEIWRLRGLLRCLTLIILNIAMVQIFWHG